MTQALFVDRIGPSVTIQDTGRRGYLALGLSRGGAADRHALAEGAALLHQSTEFAALEMAGFGGDFTATGNLRIALTGAPMIACLEGQAITWNASHAMTAGQRLSIGAATRGIYGYLHLGGGIATLPFLGSRSTHLAGGIGKPVAVGDNLPAGPDPDLEYSGMLLEVPDRFSGGTVRLLPSVHTEAFSAETRSRFEETEFHRTLRGNRQAAELAFEGKPFASHSQLNVLSEPMVPGDIQMTGEGMPFVLLPECQTTGGYPRIGTVLPDDLPLIAQATPGVVLHFKFVFHAEARALHVPLDDLAAALSSRVRSLIRHPSEIRDLLSYQLISGATTGWDDA